VTPDRRPKLTPLVKGADGSARPGGAGRGCAAGARNAETDRAATMYTLIQTAKLNDVDPQAWLADVLARIADTPQTKLADLLPWNWAPELILPRAA
jgi:hypothetical protein